MYSSAHSRLMALLLVAGLTAAGGVGCSTHKNDDTQAAGISAAQLDGVDISFMAMRADDYDSRPAGGGPRPSPVGEGQTHVGAETASAAMSPAAASTEDEFLTLTNQQRQAVGVPAVTRNDSLDGYARAQAAAMAAAGRIFHSDISTLLTSWWTVGENVGTGPDAPTIEAAYVASPGHYRNLSDATFTATGLGVYIDTSGRIWTAQEFAA